MITREKKKNFVEKNAVQIRGFSVAKKAPRR